MSHQDRVDKAVEYLQSRFSASLLRLVFSQLAGIASALTVKLVPVAGCILGLATGILLYYLSSIIIARRYPVLRGRQSYTVAVFSYLAGWYLTYIIAWSLLGLALA